MRTALFAAAAAIALLSGCREGPAGEGNSAAVNNATAAPEANEAAAAAPLAPVSGDEAKHVMHERHEGMEDIGKATKLLGRETKSDSPDLAKVKEAAATIAGLAPKVSSWFPAGTGPDVGKTGAKPVIWEKPEDFATRVRDFQQAAARFHQTAQGGDVAAIKAGFGDLGKTCKGCHDTYRSDMHKK